MDYGRSGEMIFEDRLEARVAAQLLKDAGRSDLVEHMQPPLARPYISFGEFAKAMRNLRKGVAEEGVHRIEEPEIVQEYIDVLGASSNLNNHLPAEKTGRRKDYMGAKLLEFRRRVEEAHKPRVLQLGDLAIVTTDNEQVEFLTKRAAFVEQYFAERGWDMAKPTIEQLLEVRSQPAWQDPDQNE
jgi:hypothetical protein